jgi:cytochrome c heme-lyase
MPFLTQEKAPGQTLDLPTARTLSTIPKTNTEGKVWEYPSPQQFLNALVKKGWETPEQEIPVIVDIHNFINEECWDQIMYWEKKYHCACDDVSLSKFQGRPRDLTPKAWFYHKFRGAEKPFDRHDWTVDRCGEKVRYVIDYYGGPEEDGNPVFHCDIRPALDSPSAFFDRVREGASRIWDKFLS